MQKEKPCSHYVLRVLVAFEPQLPLKHIMDLENTYPAISDLRARSRRRIPHFAWEYLDSATGQEDTMRRNRAALDAVLFDPAILGGDIDADLTTQLLGQTLSAPFGIAPVGMSGLMWPDAERLLARIAAKETIPYCMSTVAAQTPEKVGPLAGNMGWFQLYAPRDKDIRDKMLKRISNSGFHTLVLTVDVPAASRRERQCRGGLTTPPRLTPRLLAQVATCPAWALGMLQQGMPRMRFLDSYIDQKGALSSTAHVGYLIRTAPDWDYLRALRADWKGKLIVKGVTRPDDASALIKEGIDAIWVSNHGGRQFDAAPAALTALQPIRAAIGTDIPIIFDSGVQGGLDILRAIAHGADFVMLGRGFHYGLGAFGEIGAEHVVHILRQDILANMKQLNLSNPTQARDLQLHP